MSEILRDAVDREDLSPLDRLALYIRNQTLYNAEHVVEISVYYRDVDQLGAERLGQIRTRQREHVALLTGLVDAGKAAGEIQAEVDGGVVVRAILSTVAWIYTWYDPKGPVSPADLAEFNVGFALRGIAVAT